LNAALVLASLCVAVLLAEIAIRLVAPQQLILIRPDLWQPDDTVGWLHRPNVDIQINTGERTVRVLTDAEGFRVGPDSAADQGSQILFLGDSFVEALQVEHAQSAAGVLQELVSNAFGRPVLVRNAGIGGWGPSHYALRARSLLARHPYDLVITAVYLGNDIVSSPVAIAPRAPAERYRLRLPSGTNRRELTNAILRPVNDFMEVRSHLYIFVRSRLQTLRMQVGLAPIDFPRHLLVSNRNVPDWGVTADILATIDSAASSRAVPTLFVLIPAPFQVDSTNLSQYVRGFGIDPATVDIQQPNELMRAELERRGLRVFDPLPAFQDAHSHGTPLHGVVDPHFSPEGNRLLAELLVPVVVDVLSTGDGTNPSAEERPAIFAGGGRTGP